MPTKNTWLGKILTGYNRPVGKEQKSNNTLLDDTDSSTGISKFEEI